MEGGVPEGNAGNQAKVHTELQSQEICSEMATPKKVQRFRTEIGFKGIPGRAIQMDVIGKAILNPWPIRCMVIPENQNDVPVKNPHGNTKETEIQKNRSDFSRNSDVRSA